LYAVPAAIVPGKENAPLPEMAKRDAPLFAKTSVVVPVPLRPVTVPPKDAVVPQLTATDVTSSLLVSMVPVPPPTVQV
jgi:hypothetical protein